ncbi:MAG: tetratricopeptide repeat protein [Desertifilum sp.]|nr:tetratricopeptide repeat protein [Desertifilum sp.]
MARRSLGSDVQARVKRFFEGLLAYIDNEYEEGDSIKIDFNWQGETQVVVKAKRRYLEELTLKDRYEGELTPPQVREALKRLEDYLGILEDHRTTPQGSDEWHFTLHLWHRDKAENLKRFDLEWEQRRPEKSKQAAAKTRTVSPEKSPQPSPYSNLGCKGIINPDEFIGREEELGQLYQLLQNNRRIAISAIAGMGGVGKTELAIQYGRRYLGEYPGGVYWFFVRGGDLAAQLIQFTIARYPNFALPEQLQDPVRQVEYCLQHWEAGKALLILDDVADYGEVKPYLEILPARFQVVITTRRQGLGGRKVQQLPLGVLPRRDALRLLGLLVGRERLLTEPWQARRLCQWLGYLPLGLELVGRYLARKPDLALAEMLRRLEEKRLEQLALRKPDADMTNPVSIQAAFELSWDELDETSRGVMLRLGVFALAPIPWELVEKCLSEMDAEELEETRDDLVQQHLVLFQDKGFYKLHPLIREFCQMKLAETEEQQEFKSAFAYVMLEIAKQIPQQPTRDLILKLTPGIPHLAEVANRLTDCLSNEDFEFLWLAEGLGRFYEGQGLYTSAEPWRQQCVAVAKQRLEADHPSIAASLNNLAGLYKSEGRYSEAEPLFLQALDIARRSLFQDHPSIATSLHNLAVLYYQQERYAKAAQLLQEALEIFERKLGEQHPDTINTRKELETLQQAQPGSN